MNLVQKLHLELVFPRRISRLAKFLVDLIPKNALVLDVGCGDGTLDRILLSKRPDLKITGLDILRRKKTLIPVVTYDGQNFPFGNNSFDCVIFIDTLHHTESPQKLLAEARRVAKSTIIIKDHYVNNWLSFYILKFMDWVGNKFYSVNLPYNYLSKNQWQKIYQNLNLKKEKEITHLSLYPFPFNLIFERNLHFIIKLTVKK